jgi:predicted RNA-binding Zn-ribbon protein involved in translation (DUF1610 family)
MMNPTWRLCPDCGAALDKKTVSLDKSFACPGCGEKLRVKQAGFRVRALIVFLLSPLLAYEFGLRGLSLVIVSALGLWPLGLAAKLMVSVVFPPRVVVRPHDDPEIKRCPKCGIELEDKFEMRKPFACPACGERLEIVTGRGFLLMAVGLALWLFVGTPLASLLGYEFGVRGIHVSLLPLAVFLGGAAIFGLVLKLAGSNIRYVRVKVAPHDSPATPPSLGFRETLDREDRTELKLDNWKHT